MSDLDEDESVLHYGNLDTITPAGILDTIKDIDYMLDKLIIESSDYDFLKKHFKITRNGLKNKFIVANSIMKRIKE